VSRWIEQFETHAFQATWASLKARLDESTVDDETVVTSVEELARLNKVIFYLDGLIHGSDPELVPQTTWDNFNTQATTCSQKIVEYSSNRNITHIQQANTHADNLLTYIRPYMLVEGKAGRIMQDSIKKYAKIIDEYSNSFRDSSKELVERITEDKAQSATLFASIESSKKAIDDIHSELLGGGENDPGIKGSIDDLVEDFENKHSTVVEYYNETFVGDDIALSTKKEISQAKAEILNVQKKIVEILDDTEEESDNLSEFHTKIFGKPNADNELEGGLKSELATRMEKLADFEVKQNEKYEALNLEIESLIPGATSAGLASAYKDMKNSFDGPIKNSSNIFYASLGLLIFASLVLAIDTFSFSKIVFVKFSDWNVVLKGLAYKIPFYAPILWLAFYATKRRSEYQRLQQEYAHKEALAKSYHSYKKQIIALGDDDNIMQREFIEKAIDAISYNASETLDSKHGDNMPLQEITEKVLEASLKLKGLSA
jgi:hypothetical protein